LTAQVGLILALGIATNSSSDEALKRERARFEGVWSIALVEVEGVRQPAASNTTTRVIITKDGRFIVVQGPKITRGVFKLDLTKMPKHYDQTVTQGPAKGRSFSCIYELNDDTYKLCGSFRGKERPTAFGSTPGSGLIYQVLKRERQTVKEALIEVGRKDLAGTWQALSYTLDGKAASADDMKKVKLVIDAGGKGSAYSDGKLFIASTITIDPTASPMAMDISFTEGNQKGKTALGIYKIEDDILTICRAEPDYPRPTEFASAAGSGLTLMTYNLEGHSR
jgi:uncharacterized protein (TIGR03067 family)